MNISETDKKYLEASRKLHEILKVTENVNLKTAAHNFEVDHKLFYTMVKHGVIVKLGRAKYKWGEVPPNMRMVKRVREEINERQRESASSKTKTGLELDIQSATKKAKRNVKRKHFEIETPILFGLLKIKSRVIEKLEEK